MVTINICMGNACYIKGSFDVINSLQDIIDENNLNNDVELKAAICLGECVKAVAVTVDDSKVYSVSTDSAKDFFYNKVMPHLMKCPKRLCAEHTHRMTG